MANKKPLCDISQCRRVATHEIKSVVTSMNLFTSTDTAIRTCWRHRPKRQWFARQKSKAMSAEAQS